MVHETSEVKQLLASLSLILCLIAGGQPAGQAAETPATHPSLRAAELPPLIPARELYTDGCLCWGHQVSPDGTRLAWVQPFQGKPTLHVRVLDGGNTIVMNHPMPVARFFWALDSRHLLFPAKVAGGKNRHLFAIDTHPSRKAPRDLTPFEGVNVPWMLALLGKPGSVLVWMNLRTRRAFDLHEIDLTTGDHVLRATNSGRTTRWMVSRTGRVLARVENTDNGGWELQRAQTEPPWKTVLTGDFNEQIAWLDNVPEGSSIVYARTNVGRDKHALVALDLRTGAQEVLFEPRNTDVSRFFSDIERYRPLRVTYHEGLPRDHYFDPRLQEELERFLDPGPNAYTISSGSLDHRMLTLTVATDQTGTSTYLIDRQAATRELLFASPTHWHVGSLSEKRPVRFNARDGLPLSGYLTLPKGTDGKRLPMVLKVHGGPWNRDYWFFDADTQFLANRGYAVLAVNFRGSGGFGKAFIEKGRKEFGARMQDDLTDAVDWAVAQGYADPERIAIYGHSYGGYAALMGLIETPEKFAAGIDVAGPTSLPLQVNTFPASKKRTRLWWTRLVGDPDDPEGFQELMERSPITHADKIRRPLLIVHGAKDSRVLKRNSDQLVDKLRENGAPVEYLVFPKEGHNIRRTANRLKFAHRMELFLARHLGGRAARPD